MRRAKLFELSEIELHTAKLRAMHLTHDEIAVELGIGVGAVRSRLERVYAKLGVHNVEELAAALSRDAGAASDPESSASSSELELLSAPGERLGHELRFLEHGVRRSERPELDDLRRCRCNDLWRFHRCYLRTDTTASSHTTTPGS